MGKVKKRELQILLMIREVILIKLMVYHGAKILAHERLGDRSLFLQIKFIPELLERIISPTKPIFIKSMTLGV